MDSLECTCTPQHMPQLGAREVQTTDRKFPTYQGPFISICGVLGNHHAYGYA